MQYCMCRGGAVRYHVTLFPRLIPKEAPVRTLFLALASLLALSACSRLQVLNNATPDSGYTLSQNIVYDGATGQRLDVYSPQGAANAPVVVFFYGGRWQMGSKDEYKFVGQALAARGFVAVLPNYRLYPQVKYPDFLTDCADAVAWVHSHIGGYGGSAARIVLMGHDAGAYNAAMLTLDPEFLAKAGGNRNWVRGMVGLAGAYDFLPLTDPDLRDLFGAPENYQKTQPVLYVDGSNPPLLLMHGGKDETIPASNTNSLYDRVRRAGGSADKVLYPDLDHEWLIADLSVRLQSHADVMDKIAAFIQHVTSGNAPQNNAPSSIQTYIPPK